MRRFEQECEFLSTIRHPNIIQYLGMYQDPDTHLPVLLMELMDDSLTHFLEGSPKMIPYHIQVNICYDITLALSFLHSNGIIHRDLSSNNVLMIGNILAKVTDFGMAKLGDTDPQATPLTFTMCPGTDVYMPPEAVQDKPIYTEKIDCFSFGVIAIQIMTQLFPKPGDRRQKLEIENVGLVEKRVSECERRQSHLTKIDPNHPLLAVALKCLMDEDVERPSSQELCKIVDTLKKAPKYSESVRESFQQKRETIAAGLLKIETMSKQHLDKIQELQTDRIREITTLRSKIEELKEEHSVTEKQINDLQFHISEMKSSTLHKLCRDGDMDRIKSYVNRIADNLFLEKMLANKRGFSGYTPLHEAAANGKSEVLKYLLDLIDGRNVNYRTGTNGHTPLHLAASNGHGNCVLELIAHGADISCVDVYGKTPRKTAELRSKGNVVKILLSEGEIIHHSTMNDRSFTLGACARVTVLVLCVCVCYQASCYIPH